MNMMISDKLTLYYPRYISYFSDRVSRFISFFNFDWKCSWWMITSSSPEREEWIQYIMITRGLPYLALINSMDVTSSFYP